MRVLIAMDKFKGSLTAAEAGEAVRRGLEAALPGVECEICPMADGGEGTADAVVAARGGRWIEALSHDAHGRETRVRYGLVDSNGATEAVMEMSAASGLAMVSDLPLNPNTASSYGTGEMMMDAVMRRVKRIVMGIGGSATNDGGMGMAAALGYQFLDTAGRPVKRLPMEFETVRSIRPPQRTPVEVLVACDVNNPLLGDKGATRVYGPQKGIRDIAFFEGRLRKLADLVARDLGVDHRDAPGSGAAGGLGFGLMSFCKARLAPGFEIVASIVGLERRIADADLVITGEGRMDEQTLHGKGPAGVAEMARKAGKKVVGLAGALERGPGLEQAFDLLLQSKPIMMSVEDAIRAGGKLLEEKVVESAALIQALTVN